ncbi:MAG: TolC family protein, partial [Alistipes sp.]|nr:TolC family protein [Alistipes sp.]
QVREQERLEILEQTQLSVKGDYVRYMESFEEVATCEKSLELAQENYAVIDTRYRHDIALMTDMLDAANQRLEAELQLTNARIARLCNLC